VEFHVNEHNTKMPHPVFDGQTPDELFFATGAKSAEELALARATHGQLAWQSRDVVRTLSRAASCRANSSLTSRAAQLRTRS
jgi:hypothetical protein